MNEKLVRNVSIVVGSKRQKMMFVKNVAKCHNTYLFSNDIKTFPRAIKDMSFHSNAWWLDTKAGKRPYLYVILDLDDPPLICSKTWLHFTGWISIMQIGLIGITSLPEETKIKQDLRGIWTPNEIVQRTKEKLELPQGFFVTTPKECLKLVRNPTSSRFQTP